MNSKQECIAKAWGVHYSHTVDEDGYRNYTEFEKHHLHQWGDDYFEKKYNKFSEKYTVRPKSLQGIENNNGWIKLSEILTQDKQESFNKLPKQNSEYDIVVNSKIIYRYCYNGNISDDRYVENNVTHFRFSEIHEPPLH